jgi:hypothetical protein
LARNQHKTMIAENSSMALSPLNPRRAGLRAVQAAVDATMASTLIQAIVSICRRAARRSNSGAGAAAAMDI